MLISQCQAKNALLIAQQKRSPWYSRGRETAIGVEFQPLIKAGAEADAFRTPRVYRLVVPEDGHREIVIPIYEQTADDEATRASYNSTTLTFDRPVPKGTRIDVWYSLEYDGRLFLRAEARVNGNMYEAPRIVGPLVVNKAHIQGIRVMLGVDDSQESTADGHHKE